MESQGLGRTQAKLGQFRPKEKELRVSEALSRLRVRCLDRARPNRPQGKKLRLNHSSLMSRTRLNDSPISRFRPKESCMERVRVNEEGLSRDRANWRPEGQLCRANELRLKISR